jgi:hypothetical protein
METLYRLSYWGKPVQEYTVVQVGRQNPNGSLPL